MNWEMTLTVERNKGREEGRKEGRYMGVGLGLGGFLCTLGMWDKAGAALELFPDGTITVYNTWEDMGQGGDIGTLTVTVKALEELGIDPEKVRLVMNDSHRCPDSGVAAASRSHFMNGLATIEVGKQANLVGCAGVLDESFRALEKPEFVMNRGLRLK